MHGLLLATALSLNLHSMFYGDNTEFTGDASRYRQGETLLGVHNTLGVTLDLSGDKTGSTGVWLTCGIFTDQRAGGEKAFELVRPVVSLQMMAGGNVFIMGTLESHSLVPALEMDTLAFTRAYENGLQWFHVDGHFNQELWINWQQLNTAHHRERFDVGARDRFKLTKMVSLAGQAHIVHEGGQLYASGPVRDSFAGGPGILVFTPHAIGEAYVFWSSDDPDRTHHEHLNGRGLFLRASYQKNDWRLAITDWHSRQFTAWEGDANYQARRYDELSGTRQFRLNEDVRIETSARLYHFNDAWSYSYRVLGIVDFTHPLGKS